jgi:hypothetical protein
MLNYATEMAKWSAKSSARDFYPKNFNHAVLPQPKFERYRNYVKKRCEDYNHILDVNEHETYIK